MQLPFNLIGVLESALRTAAVGCQLDAENFKPEVRATEARHGDFQANGVLPLARAAKQNPRALAERLVAALPPALTQDWQVVVAGPGFINFTLLPGALATWLKTYSTPAALAAGAATLQAGQTWVVDYSSPNTAKQMHVGHLRSIVIGEAIARLAAYGGARVVRDNHIGDWGTQFGKLIWAYRRQLDVEAFARDPLEEFERLYKVGNTAAENDPAVLAEAQAELVRLQAGEVDNLAVWRLINEVSLRSLQEIYDLFGVRFDVTLGESFYNDKVDRVYRELTATGIAEDSQGALVVFHDDHPRFARTAERPNPFMVRKSDGAANYASTDLATILYRCEHFAATDIFYVVDKRQADHFEQLFLTAQRWFAATGRTLPRLQHLDFGTVLGENGKPLKTRTGDNIKLKDLLAEATERARRLVDEKSRDLTGDERAAVAAIVGIGSVQYADLCQNRSSDYVFTWDKMISLEGNTAAYLLYAVARLHSIFRRVAVTPGDPAAEATASPPVTPTELTLARRLIKFSDALLLATGTLRPHFLCLYLYELAGDFSAFYAADKVDVEDAPVRARRLQLCARTLLVLETGLQLLGLRTVTRM